MKRLSLFLLLSAACYAQLPVTASNITDAFNNPIKSARLCFMPVNGSQAPVGFRTGSQQVVPNEVCATVTNGVLQSGKTIAPTSTGVQYHIYLKSQTANTILRDYGYTPITAPFSLDTYDSGTGTLPSGSVSLGSVTALAPGSTPTANITGGTGVYQLNLGIPSGISGVGTDPNCHTDGSGNLICATVATQHVNNTYYLSAAASLSAVDALSAANGNPVYVDANVTLAADITLNGNYRTAGGIISCNGHNLTFSKPFVGGAIQWLNCGSTAVHFATGQADVVLDWFGIKYDSTYTSISPLVATMGTDNTVAVNEAAASAKLGGQTLVSYSSHTEGSTTGFIGVAGQLVFDNVQVRLGSSAIGAQFLTTYTAGCAVVASNFDYGTFGGFALKYGVSTAGVTTASGVCPETFRRAAIVGVRVVGAYKALDASVGTGTGLFQARVEDFWAISPTGYGLYLAAQTGGGTGSNKFVNVRVDCSLTRTQAVVEQVYLATASDNSFDTLNLQDCMGGGIFEATDVHHTTWLNNHWEQNTVTATGASSEGFMVVRGNGSNTIIGLSWVANFLNSANLAGTHFALFLAQTGQAVFNIDHIYSLENTLTGVTNVPLCEFIETGGMAPGKCNFARGSIDNYDATLLLGAQGNFATSIYSTYTDATTLGGFLNPNGGIFSPGDTDRNFYCGQNDRNTYTYLSTFTTNHTLTLEVPYSFNGCTVTASVSPGIAAGFHLTVADSLGTTLATLYGGQSATFKARVTSTTGTAAITAFATAGAVAPNGGAYTDLATFQSAVQLAVGQSVTISGLSTGTYLNGLTGTVQATNLNGTQFSIMYPSCNTGTHCNVVQTTDTGTVTFTYPSLWTIQPPATTTTLARGWCSGTAPSGAASLYLYGMGASTASTCTVTSNSGANLTVMGQSYTVTAIYAEAAVAGVNAASGTVALYVNGTSVPLGGGCVFGTTRTCAVTGLNVHGNPGDLLAASFSTFSGETLAGVQLTVQGYFQ
jgi:hypothetical protein